jgi:hypothetical protein
MDLGATRMSKFTFTDSEKQRLQTAYNAAFAQYDSHRTMENVFTATYDVIIDILDNADPSRLDDDDITVRKWVRGAREVNGGSGFFKDFIREYTIYEHTTRYYGPLRNPDTLSMAQEASNGVANNFLSDVVGRFSGLPSTWTIPNIRDTGFNDAGSAASTVFKTPSGPEYAPWAGTLLFPYLGYDQFFQEWLLTNDQVLHQRDGKGIDRTVAVQSGTYNLVAAIRSGYEATIKAGLETSGLDFYQLVKTALTGPHDTRGDTLDSDQSNLISETNDYFRIEYGLDPGTTLRPGDALVFSGSGVFGGKQYQFGSVQDDVGEHKLVMDYTTRVLNSGAGDDMIEATPYSTNSSLNVIVDGGDGKDTLVFTGSNVTLQFDDKGHWGWRGVASYSDGISAFLGYPPETGTSGLKVHDVYNVEKYVLTDYQDKLLGNDLFFSALSGKGVTIDLAAGEDVVDFTTMSHGISDLDQTQILNGEHFYLSKFDDNINLSKDETKTLIDIYAGAGNDSITVQGGTGVTIYGDAGRDFIWNKSVGGITFGDTKDGIDPESVVKILGVTVSSAFIADEERSGADLDAQGRHRFADKFEWSSGTTIMDAGYYDHLDFFGIPLVGGNTSGGFDLLVKCESAWNKGSDSISLKFGGDLVLFSEGNQRHAVRYRDFNISPTRICCRQCEL